MSDEFGSLGAERLVSSTHVRSPRQRGWSWLMAVAMLAVTPLVAAEVTVVGSTAGSRAAEISSEERRAAKVDALHAYIGDRYRVPRQAVRAFVDTAWSVGQDKQLDPLLLLAVMAIESSFNPKAESHMGAQGLMQVMTRIHRKRFEPYGGVQVALKPDVNIEVGAQILQECIDRRGSVAAGLSCYVGVSTKNSRYGERVLAERERYAAVVEPLTEPLLLADADEPDYLRDDHVIEAPPISRLAEADAPRLALSLLSDEEAGVDL